MLARTNVLVAFAFALALGCTDSDRGSGDDAGTPDYDGGAPARFDAAAGRGEAAVFFSGHSLINVNTPAFFEQLAERDGRAVSYQLQMGLGSTMGIRLACPRSGQQAAGAAIAYDLESELARPGAYDTLIVTERHDIVTTIVYERSTAMARRFRDLFAAGNPSGQPFLFESWYTIDAGDPEAFRARAARELVAWQCIASKVNESRGDMPPMLVIPAGQAISKLVGDVVAGRAPGLTRLDQLFADDVHLTNLGNYFIALIHYAVTLRRSPVGLPFASLEPVADAPPVLDEETARYLQELAGRYAERTFADAALSQRSGAECEAALTALCRETLGSGDWGCTQIAAAYHDDTAAVPTFEGEWCRR